VPAVFTRWPPSQGELIGRTTVAELRSMTFEPGSMAPKVEAACRFAERTGRFAGIGAIDQAGMILDGTAGTTILAQC
jgi:carbamate kinase